MNFFRNLELSEKKFLQIFITISSFLRSLSVRLLIKLSFLYKVIRNRSHIHILTYPYPYRTVPNRTLQKRTIWDRTQAYPTVLDRTVPVPNRTRPYPTVPNHTRPYSTLPNRTRPHPTVHDRIKSYPTVSGRTWNNEAVDQDSFEFSIIHYKWFS